MNYDLLNFVIATCALLVSLYSVYYAHRSSRPKITTIGGNVYITSDNPPIAWFEICNISPVPVTITDIVFSTPSNEIIEPLFDYEPARTCSSGGPFNIQLPVMLSDYQYSEPLDPPCIIQPHESLELGYYFQEKHITLTVTVTCAERIYHFGKTQSFPIHFSEIID